MGWLFMERGAETPKQYLDRQCTWETDTTRNTLLRSAMVGLTYYAAVERIDKQNGKRDVFAVVCLVRYTHRKYGADEWGYKDMDETCGPVEAKCPKTILNLLTPTDHEYAAAWRKRCWSYHERGAAVRQFVSGTKVRYGGRVYTLGEHLARRRSWIAYDEQGTGYRFGPSALRCSEVVEAAA